MHDLNTKLANARYEFIGRVEELADRAKQTRQNLADSGMPESSDHARQAKAEAERYEQDASIWRLRAKSQRKDSCSLTLPILSGAWIHVTKSSKRKRQKRSGSSSWRSMGLASIKPCQFCATRRPCGLFQGESEVGDG